jgi:4-hydroxybenzoate polyprenyltransferase
MQKSLNEKVLPGRGLFWALVATVRPKQWIKNFFVFGPLLFSHELKDGAKDLAALAGFALFCLAASGVYIVNDLMDLEADRLHPTKRLRPIASGRISQALAAALAVILLIVTAAGSLALGNMFALLILCYVLMNISYSLGLKQVVIIDVMMIGGGFVIRVLAGAAAIRVSPSHWLVLCTILLAVFLGFTKRRAELTLLQENAVGHRKVLTSYSAAFLDQMISVVTAATLMCYILYAVDVRTVEAVGGGSRGLLLTVPLVMYGIFRYLYLVYHLEEGGSPTQALLEDRMMLLSVVLWVVLCVVVIYFPEYFKGWFSS